MTIIAPFPYFGGKRRLAPLVWERFGKVHTYIEPFAGSLAVLLANPNHPKREIVGDTNSAICNFWRSVSNDPETVARYAVYPTIHQDLTARHIWLINWFKDNSHKFSEDPDFHDCKVAGWWCYGICLWIGGQFCDYEKYASDQIPFVRNCAGGQGTNAQRLFSDKIPHIQVGNAGRGINAQTHSDKIPFVYPGGSGSGTSAQRNSGHMDEHMVYALSWLSTIQNRLFKTIVLNRSWESCVTNVMLGSHDNIAVFMDPPYTTEDRKENLYMSDRDNRSTTTARLSYEWAVEHGDKMKIAYCMAEGSYPVPDNWTIISSNLTASKKTKKNEIIMFSPECIHTEKKVAKQGELFS